MTNVIDFEKVRAAVEHGLDATDSGDDLRTLAKELLDKREKQLRAEQPKGEAATSS